MTASLWKQAEKMQTEYAKAKRSHRRTKTIWLNLRDLRTRELKRYPVPPGHGFTFTTYTAGRVVMKGKCLEKVLRVKSIARKWAASFANWWPVIAFTLLPGVIAYGFTCVLMLFPDHPFQLMAADKVPWAMAVEVTKLWLIGCGVLLVTVGIYYEVME